MPSAIAGSSATKNGAKDGKEKVLPIVPFVRASGLHRETMLDRNIVLTTSEQDLGLIDVPAYGYLRALWIECTVTGSVDAGSDTVGKPDAPWNVLKNITFQEPNGATIFQANSGYDLYLINKYGGYRGFNDPKRYPSFSAVNAQGNFAFAVRVPFEIGTRDALGCLPNQDSAAAFKFRATVAAIADLYTSLTGITPGTLNIKIAIETWDQPPANAAGAQNQTMPPAVNTTQFWSPQQYPVNAGEQSPQLKRVGNFIRNWIFTFRDATGVRVDQWPPSARLMLDARPKDIVSKSQWWQQMYERYGYSGTLDTAGALDTGVFAYDFTHEFDGVAGHENRDLWLPTLGSTRLELQGNYPVAGTLNVLTNDVSVAGVVFM